MPITWNIYDISQECRYYCCLVLLQVDLLEGGTAERVHVPAILTTPSCYLSMQKLAAQVLEYLMPPGASLCTHRRVVYLRAHAFNNKKVEETPMTQPPTRLRHSYPMHVLLPPHLCTSDQLAYGAEGASALVLARGQHVGKDRWPDQGVYCMHKQHNHCSKREPRVLFHADGALPPFKLNQI